ncbi:uncharacterized protein LOC119958021 isoform X2 [Scyliorhinus canicula]|nr:uncharacterized protein LOC119958021 isoform X2 [Scyliorhinus canicula]XP_038642213.1 uncharacterized protein LOC119958021 isoform X2 [Scyliorhinus canicula]
MWCFTANCDHMLPRNMRSSISTLSSALSLLLLIEHGSGQHAPGQQSGAESHGHAEIHSLPLVAALAMCLAGILFLLMLCVLFTPQVIVQCCGYRRKGEDRTAQPGSLPTYEEAVFGDHAKFCSASKVDSVFLSESYALQCGPQTVPCPTLQGAPFYQGHFGPSSQRDMALLGIVLSGEAKDKEPPIYQDIYPTRTGDDPAPPRLELRCCLDSVSCSNPEAHCPVLPKNEST